MCAFSDSLPEEFQQVRDQAPELGRAVEVAPETLKELLRNPFNLWLLAKLVDDGVSQAELNRVTTHVQLLDRYWERRVAIGLREKLARESLLTRFCSEMVAKRRLRVPVGDVSWPEASEALAALLSGQVLTGWQPPHTERIDDRVLTFAHHVLFDYATAKLLLPADAKALVERLETDPEFVVVARPSVVMHFHELWEAEASRAAFWNATLAVARAKNIPQVGKLLAPAVAAELARSLEDLLPLCEALESADVNSKKAGQAALGHMVGALLEGRGDMGEAPWPELLARVSGRLDEQACIRGSCAALHPNASARRMTRRISQRSVLPLGTCWSSLSFVTATRELSTRGDRGGVLDLRDRLDAICRDHPPHPRAHQSAEART